MAKILLHTLVFSPDCVSTAYLMADLAEELQQLGHEVTVLTTCPHYNVLESEMLRQPLSPTSSWVYSSKLGEIAVWHLPMKSRTANPGVRSLGYLGFHCRSIIWAFRSGRAFDVVMAPSPPLSIGLVAWLISRRYGAACVYNVQELYPDFAINNGLIKNKLVVWMLKTLEKIIYNKCDAVVTIAKRFTNIVSSRCSCPGKVQTIPNFVDTEFYRPLPRDNNFSREYGLMNFFVVLYAGNIGAAQDWNPILYAAHQLREQPVKFVVLGDGTHREWLIGAVTQRKLNNILVLKYHRREMMPEINAACNVATITMAPNAGRDGFPSKIYTTMACARPSIVSTELESELAWAIRASNCGTVVPVGDNVAYADAVLAAFRRRHDLLPEGLRGRAFVERRYSKKTVALQYDSLIKSLVHRRSQ